jgi:hypothetical protein
MDQIPFIINLIRSVSRSVSQCIFCDADLFGSDTVALKFDLVVYIHEALFTFLVEKHDLLKNEKLFSSNEDKSHHLHLLCQLEDVTMCHWFDVIRKLSEFVIWLFDVWEVGDNPVFSVVFLY